MYEVILAKLGNLWLYVMNPGIYVFGFLVKLEVGKTLHISHIDESLMRALELLAQKEHTSVEEIVKRHLAKLSAEEMPVRNSSVSEKHIALAKIAGIWNADDARAFDEVTAPFREIDPSLWQ